MQGVDVKVIFILTLLYILSIGLNASSIQYKNANFDLVGEIVWWIEKFGVVGVFVTVIFYFYQQRRDLRNNIHRSCKTLLVEIRENSDGISHFEHFWYSYINRKEEIRYTNVIFDNYAFQSVLHSGLFTYFKEETQTRLAQIYSRIDIHNKQLNDLMNLRAQVGLQRIANLNQWRNNQQSYESFLTETEFELVNLFEDVEFLLKKEADIE